MTSPRSRLAWLLLFAVVWNGFMVLVVAMGLGEYHDTGSVDGCMVAIVLLFLLPGLFALYLVPQALETLKSPRPVLVLDDARPEPGTRTTLRWSFANGADRVYQVRLSLHATETAITDHGTTSHEDVETFFQQELVETESDPWQGSVPLAIPSPTMHTFLGRTNRVAWSILLQARVHGLPGVDEIFDLVVHPRRVEP